jgi:hypothetical protein
MRRVEDVRARHATRSSHVDFTQILQNPLSDKIYGKKMAEELPRTVDALTFDVEASVER